MKPSNIPWHVPLSDDILNEVWVLVDRYGPNERHLFPNDIKAAWLFHEERERDEALKSREVPFIQSRLKGTVVVPADSTDGYYFLLQVFKELRWPATRPNQLIAIAPVKEALVRMAEDWKVQEPGFIHLQLCDNSVFDEVHRGT